MSTGIIAAAIAESLACAVLVWGWSTLQRVRAFDHFFSAFAAAVVTLQKDESFPKELLEDLLDVAPFAKNRTIANWLVSHDVFPQGNTSEEKIALMRTLSEEQMVTFIRATFSLLVAISFTSSHGKKYRERLFDKVGDRKTVIKQANALRDTVPHGELCAA